MVVDKTSQRSELVDDSPVATLKAVFLALRPKTLSASVVPIGVASVLAAVFTGRMSMAVVLFSLLSCLCIQIGTNLINDALDFKKGADTSKRLGPTRATQAGWLSATQVMVVGGLFFLMAVLFGIPLVLVGGWPIVMIGVISILCGYAYTAGPMPLAYVGLGDLFVTLFFGLVAVSGVYYLHAFSVDSQVFVAGLQVGLLANALLVINNLRDVDSDKLANKRTLAVRFGVLFSRWQLALLYLLAFTVNLVWWFFYGKAWATLLPLLLLPMAILLVRRVMQQPPSERYNRYLAHSAVLQMLFGFLLCIGLILS